MTHTRHGKCTIIFSASLLFFGTLVAPHRIEKKHVAFPAFAKVQPVAFVAFFIVHVEHLGGLDVCIDEVFESGVIESYANFGTVIR